MINSWSLREEIKRCTTQKSRADVCLKDKLQLKQELITQSLTSCVIRKTDEKITTAPLLIFLKKYNKQPKINN